MSDNLVLTSESVPPEADVQAAKRVLEAVLLASQEPLSSSELRRVFDNELSADTLRKLLEELRQDWHGRGVELVQVATGWRFQTRLEYQKFIERLRPERPLRYSRAVMETLAIIAYRQPVTRGDIEDIRGVSVSSQILKTLEARGWIDVVGHKEVPGRPALFATTKALLDDLGLRSLQELPPLTQLEELEARAAGIETPASDDAGAEPALLSVESNSSDQAHSHAATAAFDQEDEASNSEGAGPGAATQTESDFATTETSH